MNPGSSEPKALKREMAEPRFERRSCSFIYCLDTLFSTLIDLNWHFKCCQRTPGENIWKSTLRNKGFEGGAVVKNPLANASRCKSRRRPGFGPWIGRIPWRRAWQPTPVSLPGESHGQQSLVGYSPWGHKQLDTTE